MTTALEMEELHEKRAEHIKKSEDEFLADVEMLKVMYKSYGKTEKARLKRYAKEIMEAYFSRKYGETTPKQWEEFKGAKKVLIALGCSDKRWI